MQVTGYSALADHLAEPVLSLRTFPIYHHREPASLLYQRADCHDVRENRVLLRFQLEETNFCASFFQQSDYIALVQFFLAAYFLASEARCALATPRDLVVDAD